MTRKIITAVIILLSLFPIGVLIFTGTKNIDAGAEEKAKAFFEDSLVSADPCTKADGSPFTVAYVDIDPYPASGEMLYYFVQRLAETGWITLTEKLPFDPEDTDCKEMINYLADKDLGKYIRFTRDANYYIAVDDLEECKRSLTEHVKKKDIDLIFCLGTSPGELTIKELGITDIPIMVYFSVDPVGAGLSKEEEYSGQNNVWCHTSSDVYLNQMKFYHETWPFKKIGMVYYSESVAAMNKYREAAEQLGVTIVERTIETLTDGEDIEKTTAYYDNLAKAYRELVDEEKIDAFMLNTDMIKDEKRVRNMLDVFYDNGIPVFVQNGEYYVKRGAFMVITASDAKVQAPFAVNAMAQILNGTDPGKIYQKFVASPYLSINMDVADKLGYSIPEEYLLSAEKLYINTGR